MFNITKPNLIDCECDRRAQSSAFARNFYSGGPAVKIMSDELQAPVLGLVFSSRVSNNHRIVQIEIMKINFEKRRQFWKKKTEVF